MQSAVVHSPSSAAGCRLCLWSVDRAALDDIPPFPLRMLCRQAQGFIFNSLPAERAAVPQNAGFTVGKLNQNNFLPLLPSLCC